MCVCCSVYRSGGCKPVWSPGAEHVVLFCLHRELVTSIAGYSQGPIYKCGWYRQRISPQYILRQSMRIARTGILTYLQSQTQAYSDKPTVFNKVECTTRDERQVRHYSDTLSFQFNRSCPYLKLSYICFGAEFSLFAVKIQACRLQ